MITQSENELAAASKQALSRSRVAQITPIAKAMLCLVLTALLSGCLEVKQSIFLNSDGSGDIAIKFVIQKQWAPMLVPRFKEMLQKDMPKGMQVADEVQDEAGNSVFKVTGAFKNVAELSDKDIQYVFVTEGGGIFSNVYRFEIRQLATRQFDVPVPFEFMVKMPGTIDETNGVKVSTNEVKWSQTGISKGTVLSAKSTATSPLGKILYGVVAAVALMAGWLLLSRRGTAARVAVPIQNSATAVFCTECGQNNSGSAAFCTRCGQKLLAD